ncbi:hypothetical protein, partial [Staphylococcus aureus]|uniref:hypothetical protein n=2 Tax=Bacteria TaxID=2 RepID=UPI0032B5D8E1
GLDAIWSEYGQEGFNSHWRGQRGFPLAATEALRRALEVDDPSPYNEAFEDMWSMLMDETAED